MFVVAVTRWAGPLDPVIPQLSPLLGLTPYETRLRLAGPLPVVLGRRFDPAAAERLVTLLRRGGHRLVARTLESVGFADALLQPRDLVLEGAALKVRELDPGRPPLPLPYGEILGLVRAVCVQEEQHRTTETKKKFSPGRAVATGGLMMRKKETLHRLETAGEREQLLYLFSLGAPPVLLRELRLRYASAGLGQRLSATTGENFATLVRLLRERAPGAFFDERLALQPRRGSLTAAGGNALHQVEASSNQAEVDLTAHLLVQAHLEGQL
jgi:hypothetical protein